MNSNRCLRCSPLWLLLALSGAPTRADSLLDLDLDSLSQLEVRSATGFKMPAREAPAIVSVVTAAQIESSGAVTLEEALQSVAGLHISQKHRQPLFSIRGMHTFDNPQVLVTLNDVPINLLFTGALGAGLRLPLAGVDHVEVIRGPGSAVFGADAFSGVVNIVTRDPLHEPETEVGVSLGSFKSGDAWARKTTRWGDWGVVMSAEAQRTDGDRRRILAQDQQSEFDAIFGSKASLAPGALDTQYRISNFHAEFARPDLQLRLWHFRADDMGSAWGIGEALDPSSTTAVRQSLGELRWQLPGSSERLRSSLRASWMRYWFDAKYRVFPAGTVLPVNAAGELFGAGPSSLYTFADGAIGNPGESENEYRLDWEAQYAGWEGHRVRLALGVSRQTFHAWEAKNFDNGVAVGQLVDVTGGARVYAPDLSRRNRYASLQDVWKLGEPVELTLGIRGDHFDDFGSTINPRASLVWRHAPGLLTKWLYGRAFRAPSMKEQFVASNPINLGSKTLQPERVNTFEWQIDWSPTKEINQRVSLFHYQMKDLIRLVSGTYRNVGELRAQGIEAELDWRPGDRTRLALNYSFQNARDAQGNRAPFAPRSAWNASFEQRVASALTLLAQARHVGARPRAQGDLRNALDGYRLLDLGLRWNSPATGWSAALLLSNALNARALEPAYSSAIPGDIPMPGRAWRLDGRFAF